MKTPTTLLFTAVASTALAGSLPAPECAIEVQGDLRIVTANGVPDHETGAFPNPHNPNRISAQEHRFTVAAQPALAERSTPLGMHPFGVAVNGIPFDPGAAEWWRNDPRSGWQLEPLSGVIDLGLDAHHAHVQPTGAYHYHGVPTGLVLEQGAQGTGLLGWAADGFPIYAPVPGVESGWVLRDGSRPSGDAGPGGPHDGSYVQDWVHAGGELDACNGRVGPTKEFPDGTYHYVLTQGWPVIPRCFRGTPDPSFLRGPPGGRRGPPPGRPPHGGPPPGGPPPGGRPPPGHPPERPQGGDWWQ